MLTDSIEQRISKLRAAIRYAKRKKFMFVELFNKTGEIEYFYKARQFQREIESMAESLAHVCQLQVPEMPISEN